MKKYWFGLTVAAVALASGALSGQSTKPVSFEIAAGASIPFGDYSDAHTYSYSGTVGLGFSPIGFPVGIRFEGAYDEFAGRGNASVVSGTRIITGTANLVYRLPGAGITAYLIGGGGYYSRKVDVVNASSINKPGINAGIGAVFPLSGLSGFAEARVHNIFFDGPRFVPVTFGIMF